MSRAPVSAWWKAQELLARRAHSSQEIINKLKLRNYPAAEIEAATCRLNAAGLLDDEAFAKNLVAELFLRRGYGFHSIIMRLRQKGLAKELCERVSKEFFSELEEAELQAVMMRLIERRQPKNEDKNRLFTWLKRRGFRSDEINQTLQTILDVNKEK